MFLALGPSLLASLALLGSASGSVDLENCLPNAVPETSRRFLLDGGRELPLGVWALEWSSGWITAWIFRILASEVLGLHTAMGSGVTSYTAAYALAGCGAPASPLEDARCEGAAFTEFHVGLETWMNVVDERTMSALGARAGGRLPRVLGSIGYDGRIFFSVLGETFRRAWEGHGVALDYYRSYNRTWQEPSAFFLPGSDIGVGELQPCTATRITRSHVLQGYLAATGDEGGVIRRPDGQLAPRCFDGVWWRSPACRAAPEHCVPLITGGDGYDLQFLMSSTSYLSMPVQLATAATGLWETLPLRGRGALIYWWFPDKTFATLEAKQVILPPHNKDEWARGLQRTSGSTITLGKLAAASLEAVAPEAFRLLEAFSLSPDRITPILEEFVSLGQTHRQSACAWLHANEDVWRPWIPPVATCSAGNGVVDSAGQFVDNVSLAVGCKRCIPGSFSDPLRSGVHSTYLCSACPTGSVSNYFGATECEQCPPGTRSVVAAPSKPWRGSDVCEHCPVGTFQPAHGSSACLSCTAWLLGAETPFAGAVRASDCRCPEGSHRVRGAPGRPHRCAACGEGSGLLCPTGLGLPQQAAGFFAREVPVVEERDAGLLRLSDGAAGGRVLVGEPQMIRCETPARCTAGLALGHCPPHQELLACQGCEAGYVWQGASCEECSGGDWARIVVAAGIAAAAGVAAAYVGTRLSSVGHFASRAFLASLGLGVHCLQAVSSISTLNVAWVEPMASLRRVLEVLNLNIGILRIGCFFQTNSVVLEYVAGLMLPLYFVGVVLAAFGVRHLTRRRVKRSHVFNALGGTLTMLFLSMAVAAFVPFQCISNPDGTSSVSSIRSVICWRGEEHAVLMGLAAVATLLYVALPIAAVAFVTVQYPRRMVQPGWREFSARWRFAFNRFTRRCYYFGVFHMLRSFAIAVIPLTSADSTQVQILLLVGLTALCACVQSLLQPWCSRLANVLDTATSLLLITILLGSAMLLPGLDDGEVSVLQAVFALVTAGVCLVCAIPILWAALERVFPRDKYAFFLTHFKDEAACRARYWKLVVSTTSPRSRVFLDSDNLQDLDALFDTVAARTRQLVVFITPGVLARTWCAGEIAIAHQHRVPLVPIVFRTPWPASPEGIEAAVVGLGPQGAEILAGKGISLVQIRDAYGALSGAPPVLVEAFSESSYDGAIGAMLGLCSSRRLLTASSGAARPAPTAPGPAPLAPGAAEDGHAVAEPLQLTNLPSLTDVGVGLLASSEDPEAVAARGIVSHMLRARSLGEVQAFATDAEEGRSYRSVVVLLSSGALRDPDFAASVRLVLDCGLPVVPARVCKDFEFPDAAFYQRLEAGLLFGPGANVAPEDLAKTRLAYERLFRIIAMTLTASAPMPVLEAEVEGLCRRLRDLRAAPWWQRESASSSTEAPSAGGAAEAAEQTLPLGAGEGDPPQRLAVRVALPETEEGSRISRVNRLTL